MAPERDRVDYLTNVSVPPKWIPPTEDIIGLYNTIAKTNPGVTQRVMAFTAKERDDWIELLVKAVFRKEGMNWEQHKQCYEACKAKCTETRVLDAQNWSQWGGSRDVKQKLEEIEDLSEVDGILYILPAPSLIATIIVKYLRRVQTKGHNDDASLRLKNLKQFDYLQVAIRNYKTGIKYIASDVSYTPDPNAQKPKPTQRQLDQMDKEQAELQALKKELQEKARRERLELEQTKLMTEQASVQANQLQADDRPFEQHREQQTDNLLGQQADNLTKRHPFGRSDAQTYNPWGQRLYQMNDPWAPPHFPTFQAPQRFPPVHTQKEEGHMPTQQTQEEESHKPRQQAQKEDSHKPKQEQVEVSHKITRDEAVFLVGNLVDEVTEEQSDDEQTTNTPRECDQKLHAVLTEQVIVVLPLDIKKLLKVWAKNNATTEVRKWLRAAVEDKDEHTWTEKVWMDIQLPPDMVEQTEPSSQQEKDTIALFDELINMTNVNIMEAADQPDKLKMVAETISQLAKTLKIRALDTKTQTRQIIEEALAPMKIEMWDMAEATRQMDTSMTNNMAAIKGKISGLKRSWTECNEPTGTTKKVRFAATETAGTNNRTDKR